MIEKVLKFWFDEHGAAQWWKKDSAFDQLCRERFAGLHEQARVCELSDWRDEPDGRLAEILILDQLSRNMFRDMPQAFAQDALALALAQEAVRVGADKQLSDDTRRQFLYMPYMHSESRLVHLDAEQLFATLNSDSLEFERRHKAIIDRFGRYPHRNQLLGRESSAEEQAFLREPGSSF